MCLDNLRMQQSVCALIWLAHTLVKYTCTNTMPAFIKIFILYLIEKVR